MNHWLSRARSAGVWLACCLIIVTGAPASLVAEAPHITNTVPAQPGRTLELAKMWSVGGENDEIIFGMAIDSLVDTNGNLYVLDSQLCHVEVFSPSGRHLRTISGQGEGPGEVQYPQGLVLLPDGTLGIVVLVPGKLVKMTLDGVPQGDLVFSDGDDPRTGFWIAFNGDCRGETIVVAGQCNTPAETGQVCTRFLARVAETGREMTRYREETSILDLQKPRLVEAELMPSFMLASAVGPDGRVYTARDRRQYCVEVYGPDGVLERVISREFQNVSRTEHDRRLVRALMDSWLAGYPGEVEQEVEEFEPAITELFVDENNLLWVQHSRSGLDQAEGVLLTYDTFTPDGTWLQEVSIRCEGNPASDGLKFLGDGRVLLIKGYVLARWLSRGVPNVDLGPEEDQGPMEITSCRIEG